MSTEGRASKVAQVRCLQEAMRVKNANESINSHQESHLPEVTTLECRKVVICNQHRRKIA